MTAPSVLPPGAVAVSTAANSPFGSAVAGARAAVRRATTPRVLVAFLAAFLVINFARAHEMVPQLAVLRLGKLAGIPLVLLAVQRLPRWQLRAALGTKPGRTMLLIGVLMVLSVPLSIWRGNSVGYLTGTGLISFIMFVTSAAVLVDRTAVLPVLRTVVLAVFAGALRMLLPGAPVYMEGDTARRLFSYTYDPNDTAALFLVVIPVALYLGTRRRARSWLWFGAALTMLLALVRTGSRGGLLGLVAMVLTLVVMAAPRQRPRLVGASIAAMFAFGAIVQTNPELRARFASTFSSEKTDYNYTAANGRVEIWKRGMHYMFTHPVTGVGIANFPVAELTIGSELKRRKGVESRHMYTAHSSLVQIGAELGILGLLAFLYMQGAAVAGLLRVRRRALAASRGSAEAGDLAALAAAVTTSLVGLFVGGLFLSLAYNFMTLFTIALAAAVLASAASVLNTGAAGVMPVVVAAAALNHHARGRRGGLALTAPASTRYFSGHPRDA